MILVGCRITDSQGHEPQVEQFIKDYCIFERPDIPHNIAYNSKDTNVFFNRVIQPEELSGLPFTVIPIGYEPPGILLVSTVNFVLEFFFNHELVRLLPTEYFVGVPKDTDTNTVRDLMRQGCLRAYGLSDAEGWYIGSFTMDFNLDFDTSHELQE